MCHVISEELNLLSVALQQYKLSETITIL